MVTLEACLILIPQLDLLHGQALRSEPVSSSVLWSACIRVLPHAL